MLSPLFLKLKPIGIYPAMPFSQFSGSYGTILKRMWELALKIPLVNWISILTVCGPEADTGKLKIRCCFKDSCREGASSNFS